VGQGTIDESAHWRHLANIIAQAMCNGSIALCQITVTAFFEKMPLFDYLVIFLAFRSFWRSRRLEGTESSFRHDA